MLLPVVLAGACAFLDVYATQPLLPLLQQVFHSTKVAVSLTITASTMGVALAAPLIGRLADRRGRKQTIVTAALLLSAVTFFATLSFNLNELIFWRFLQGIFTPGIFVVTIAYIHEEWPTAKIGSAMAAYVSGTVIGGFSGRLVAGITAQHTNWRWSFLVLGLLNLMIALAIKKWLPEERNFTRIAQSRPSHHLALDHLSNRRLSATYAVGFCVLFTLVATFTYVVFRLAEPPFRLSPAALGSIFFVYLVGALVTSFSGYFIDRHGHRFPLAISAAIGILGVLLTLGTSLGFVIAGLAICCTGVFIAQAVSTSYIGTVAEHSRALAVGLYVTSYYAGGSVGATAPAWLWDWGGWPACVALVVTVQVITAGIALVFWSRPLGDNAALDTNIGFE
ncbi:MAG: MFS transporter [Candidatus Acidiferrales bacterium]